MSRLSVGLLSSASYARRGVLSVKIVCGEARQCATVPGDQGNVGTRPKQPPSTLRQARGQSRCCLPRFLLTSLPAYLLFSRRFLHRVRFVSFSDTEELRGRREKDIRTSVLCSSPFVPRELFCLSSDDLLFVSNVGFPINGHPLSRGDPSATPLALRSVWQPTTTIYCHRSTSTPRSVYTATV